MLNLRAESSDHTEYCRNTYLPCLTFLEQTVYQRKGTSCFEGESFSLGTSGVPFLAVHWSSVCLCDVDSNGRHFLYQLFSRCTGIIFPYFSLAISRGVILLGEPILGVLVTAPCSFHFSIIEEHGTSRYTLNCIEIFTYHLPASYSFTIMSQD